MKFVRFIGKGIVLLVVYSLITVCLIEASDYLHEIEEESYNSSIAYNFDK